MSERDSRAADGRLDDLVSRAEAAFATGQYARSRSLALEGLVDDPDAAELLRLAGLSSIELGLDDAVRYLRSLTQLRRDDPDAWRDLGQAELESGDVAAAAHAFGRAVELAPDDRVALVNLAHVTHALGRAGEAVSLLQRARAADPEDAGVLRALLTVARDASDAQAALAAARALLALDETDVSAALELADLCLVTGNYAEATRAFAHLRTLDDDDGHETYACHGQVEALLWAGDWRAALDTAIDATRLDRHQLTTDLLAFAAARCFGEADRPAPAWEELETALAAERAEHRRQHAEQEML